MDPQRKESGLTGFLYNIREMLADGGSTPLGKGKIGKGGGLGGGKHV